MCGRFFLDAKAGDILEHYNASPPDLFTARYNIAPSTPVLAFSGAGFDLYRWGLTTRAPKPLPRNHRFAMPTGVGAAWCRPAGFTNGASKTAVSNRIAVISIISCFRWLESGSTGRMPRAMKFNLAR
jgi:putative SOS response-associated peptidase YedK